MGVLCNLHLRTKFYLKNEIDAGICCLVMKAMMSMIMITTTTTTMSMSTMSMSTMNMNTITTIPARTHNPLPLSNLPANPTQTPANTRSASKLRMVFQSARTVNRNVTVISPKKLATLLVDLTLSLMMELHTQLRYADETGYHAEGAHLPTVPVV